MMEITINWNWDSTSPQHPWVYHVKMGTEEERGRCRTMSDCWTAIDSFVSELIAKAIQESRWSR